MAGRGKLMRRAYGQAAGALLALGLLAGCTSFSDSMFVLSKLEEPVKSRALTDQGITYYQLYLVNRAEYSRIPEVRRYFEVALRYDPDNLRAQAYIEKIDNFRAAEGRKQAREAQALLKRAKRSQEEDYALCLAVHKAFQLLPEDEEAGGLWQETEELRDGVVKALLLRGKNTLALIEVDTPDPAREKLTIEAFRSVSRALALEPQNSTARGQERDMRAELDGIFESRRRKAEEKIEQGRFGEAGKDLELLEELNRSLGHPYDREAESLDYGLNYRWARALLERKEYAAAETRVKAALAVRRTDEAAALKRRIAEARAASDAGASFESGLEQVDRLIVQGELSAANRRLAALARGTRDPRRSASLAERRERLRVQLPALYQRAVSAYKAEEFLDAINLLQAVLEIDVEYEQAAEYLDKALAKQKLLQQYEGQ
jgi:tetratricopeptide (TPR) repeat protein